MLSSFVLPQIVIRTLATRLRIFKVPAPSASPALKPLESALPQNGRVTRLESADPKTLDLKSFRIRTYKKGGASFLLRLGWGRGMVAPASCRLFSPSAGFATSQCEVGVGENRWRRRRW